MDEQSLADLHRQVPAAEAWDLLEDLDRSREWDDAQRVWLLAWPLTTRDREGRSFLPDDSPADPRHEPGLEPEVDDAAKIVQDLLGGEIL